MRDRFIAWYHHLARKAGDGRRGKRFDRVCHHIKVNELCRLSIQDRGSDIFQGYCFRLALLLRLLAFRKSANEFCRKFEAIRRIFLPVLPKIWAKRGKYSIRYVDKFSFARKNLLTAAMFCV